MRYVNERVVNGRQPSAELQGLQWKLADMAIPTRRYRRCSSGRAVRLAGDGGTPPALKLPSPRRRRTSPPKLVYPFQGMQMPQGGYGYSHEYPLEPD